MELREFVYLDDVSMNSHLSSLGRAIPEEIVQTAENETEKSGKAGGTFMGVGAKGKYADHDRSGIERTMSVTEPYRFEDLMEAMDEEGVTVHENPDPRSLARGDVVRLEGSAIPMSLLKFEIAIKTISNILTEDVQDSINELSENQEEEIDQEEMGQLPLIQEVIEKFTGDKIPIRMVGEDYSYGIPLKRSNMRISAAEAFIERQEFILIGRADQRILSGDSWSPILATNVMNQYLPEQNAAEQMRQQLEEAARQMGIPMEDEDWELEGHTAVIHPIAMFW